MEIIARRANGQQYGKLPNNGSFKQVNMSNFRAIYGF